jgi:site-specific recombinase XerD
LQLYRTARKYLNTSKKVFYYNPNSTLHNVNEKWIQGYYHFCELKGNAHNTISKDLEHIKKMIENGVSQRIISFNAFENYPITRKQGTSTKLTIEEVKIIENYQPENIYVKMTKEIWLFAMYHWGMRAEDVIFLKKDQIIDGIIHNNTGKGIGKSHKIEQIYFPTILGKGECYFDFIQEIPTSKLKREGAKDRINDNLNVRLKILAKECGINKNLTMHVARHTFAYICDDNGMSLNDIAGLLGHTSIKTTSNYVQSLKKDEVLNAKVKNIFK